MYGLLKKETGYTFIESILQLMLLFVFLQFFILFFYWKGSMESSYAISESSEWELFVLDFQEELTEVKSLYKQTNGGINFETDRGNIIIEQFGRVIRKRIDRLGHIPLLTEVKDVTFTINDQMIHIIVIFENGTRKERDFIVIYNEE